MLILPNGSKLIQHPSELPDLFNAEELFLDVETDRVFDNKKYGGLYPWKGDRICGVAVTINDSPDVYYVPVRHTRTIWNIELDPYVQWLRKVIRTAKRWINHNILLDAAFVRFDTGEDINCELIDTLTLAKVHDSDRFGHGLKQLSRDWLDLPMDEEAEVKAYLQGLKSKNYADVPADILGNYACGDVIHNRKLYRFLQRNRPAELAGIWATEIKLASVLHDMEWAGLKVDKRELQIDRAMGLHKIIGLSTELAELTGQEFTNSFDCIYDILINKFGLPILATKWEKGVDTGRPTFDKRAMPLYLAHPLVQSNPKLLAVVKKICHYKKEAQHQSLFVLPFLELMDDNGFIHPTYNAVVRTGRMSSRRPNSQQQNKRSKKLIHPLLGYGFLSSDASQIEYRLISHYCEDEDMIRAYNENPDMDFHQWVADMLHVKRKAGKTLNFGMAYGAGKKKVTSELASNPDIVKEVSDMIGGEVTGDRVEEFNRLCVEHASKCYALYHEKFPRIREIAYKAGDVCRYRGYIFNAYGRRRHLPAKAAHKAFNSLVQGCAMDLIKERMVSLSPRYNEKIRAWGIQLSFNVHDEVGFQVPLPLLRDPEVHGYILKELSTPVVQFRVPISWGLGISEKNWSQAASDETEYSDGTVCEAKDYKGTGIPVAGKLK